jgi:hypothetical protein
MQANTATQHELLNLTVDEIMAAIVSGRPPVRGSGHKSLSKPSLRRRNGAGLAGRCQCGRCSTCLEEARWDRIFNEKFASPDYYRQGHLQNWSTLARK